MLREDTDSYGDIGVLCYGKGFRYSNKDTVSTNITVGNYNT
jgi:hypothetical protein